MMDRRSLRLLVIATTALTAALLLVDDSTPARILVALAFALVMPGLGWAERLRLRDRGDTLLLAVTMSVCLLVLVGEGMALLRVWSVPGAFVVLAAIALLGVGLPERFRLPQRLRSRQRGPWVGRAKVPPAARADRSGEPGEARENQAAAGRA
jgi:hypothetical protein